MLLIQSTYSYVSTQINLGTAYNYCTSSQQIKIPLDDTSTNEVIHPGLSVTTPIEWPSTCCKHVLNRVRGSNQYS